MLWQAIVLSLQILLLVIGWVLFQKARAELSAQAAETPVLSEVRALHRNVKALLGEIEQMAEQTANRLERQCAEAGELLVRLDAQRKMGDAAVLNSASIQADPPPISTPVAPQRETTIETDHDNRYNDKDRLYVSRRVGREEVYKRADAGESPIEIARETGLSEGEVETLLGLRATLG